MARSSTFEPDDWDDVFAVNVRGVYLMCRAFLPPMIERGAGDVINIASVSGKRPLAGRTPYCASKMAVLGLTTTLAAEVGPLGITVNSLSPGPVRGPRMDRNFRLEAERLGITVEAATEAFVSRALLHRLVESEEVGQAVVAMLQMPGLHAADIDLSAGWSPGDVRRSVVGERGCVASSSASRRRRRAGGRRAPGSTSWRSISSHGPVRRARLRSAGLASAAGLRRGRHRTASADGSPSSAPTW